MLEIALKIYHQKILYEGADAGLSGSVSPCPYKEESAEYGIWQTGFAYGVEGSLAINVIGIISEIKKCLK